jgi:hypothetical protein
MTSLAKPPMSEEDIAAAGEFTLAMAQALLSTAIKTSGMSRAAVARALGKSEGYLSRILGGGRRLTMLAFGEILAVCQKEARFTMVPAKGVAAGTNCPVCKQPQFQSPSGLTCSNGHGGAESIPIVQGVS